MNSSGRFAIAWTTYAVDSLNHPIDYQVGARIYASSGAEVTGALAVNTPQLMGRGPAVAVDASGKILVAWQRDFATGYGGVIGRWYTASGTALGGEFTAHPFYADAQAALVATGTGRFVAVWKGTGLTGGSIWGQLLQMPADLVVSGLASPALAASGASFSVTTKILNQGGDPPQEPSRNSVGRPAPRRPPQTPSWPRSRLRHSILTMPHRRP
jgi:hypothetical protein